MLKFWLRHTTRERRPIDHGVVGCEVRGEDVPVAACAACPRLLELVTDGDEPHVRCRRPLARTYPVNVLLR